MDRELYYAVRCSDGDADKMDCCGTSKQRIKEKGDGPFHRAPRETKKSDMGVARECFRVVLRSPAEKEPGRRDELKAKQCLVSATQRCDNGNAQGPERIKIKQWP